MELFNCEERLCMSQFEPEPAVKESPSTTPEKAPGRPKGAKNRSVTPTSVKRKAPAAAAGAEGEEAEEEEDAETRYLKKVHCTFNTS